MYSTEEVLLKEIHIILSVTSIRTTRPFSMGGGGGGVPGHFFHLMEVPTMRLPNVENIASLAL